MLEEFALRPAKPEDHSAVTALCEEVWPDRDVEYLPEIYPRWLRGEHRHTLVAESPDGLVGLAQCVMLSEREAWCQGLRVHPDARGRGIASSLSQTLFDWAREAGAVVARNMVYSWNAAGMAHSRVVGFEPVTAFRWAYPTPKDGEMPDGLITDPDAAWQAWTESDARMRLAGLAADRSESWALSECRERHLRAAGESEGAIALVADGLQGMALRGRTYDPTDEDPTASGIEYAVSAWEDHEAARRLMEAIAIDAHRQDASHVRVLIPETPRHVSDAAFTGASIDEAPHFIFAADLLDVQG